MENPAGSPIIWLAQSDDKVIGHYSIIPIIMRAGNAYVTGSVACHAATHPDYQGQGVFSSLVNRCILDAGEKSVPITYGFADTNLRPTYKRYERMGHICFMIRMIKVLDWQSVLARYVRNRFLTSTGALVLRRIRKTGPSRRSFAIEAISRFDERIDAFWEQVSRGFKIIVRRDQRYLNWRYASHPEDEYVIYTTVKGHKILGYCVLGEEQWQNLRLGCIVDLLGFQDNQNAVGCLIDKAVEFFREQGVDAITCMVSERHPYTSLLRKAGFIPYPRRNRALYAAINLGGSPIDERKVYSQAILLSRNPILREKSNWFMTYGDCH